MRVGVDLIEVKRFEQVFNRHGDRFLSRVFTKEEQKICRDDLRRLAGRYAAKEAVSKALGTGIGPLGISFHDIEVLSDQAGAPVVKLHNAAKTRFNMLLACSIALSISHENDYAVAFCVLEAPNCPPGGSLRD